MNDLFDQEVTRHILSLHQLNAKVSDVIEASMWQEVWVTAEISSISMASAGHCYMELVEKDRAGGGLTAKAKANIWRNTFLKIKPVFEQSTGQHLAAGMNIMALVKVTMHPLYGYSLTVLDIDPSYTLGDLERQRREILARLEKEGVLNLNKELAIPMIPSRVAIISSGTAAGYGDFCNQLAENSHGYSFRTRLFPALMQGAGAEESILAALDSIYAEYDKWDVVVIIRGGGATSDLSCFDSYPLALNVANFPIPVITGIGHDRDQTVLDHVANTRVKTPTAAAELLISVMEESQALLVSLSLRLTTAVKNRMEAERHKITVLSQKIPSLFSILKLKQQQELSRFLQRMQNTWDIYLKEQQHRLDLIGKELEMANPERILARGYTMTSVDGRIVTDADQLKPGSLITTSFRNGKAISRIEEIKTSDR